MSTKLGVHAFHINLYLHVFFEPILFFYPMDQKGNLKSLCVRACVHVCVCVCVCHHDHESLKFCI